MLVYEALKSLSIANGVKKNSLEIKKHQNCVDYIILFLYFTTIFCVKFSHVLLL